MPIIMDKPRLLLDGRLTAHLLSDRLGEPGGIELIAVAIVIGCHPLAVQNAGTYKEHFDLMGERRITAAQAHPMVRQVNWREVALLLREKRAYFGLSAAVSPSYAGLNAEE